MTIRARAPGDAGTATDAARSGGIAPQDRVAAASAPKPVASLAARAIVLLVVASLGVAPAHAVRTVATGNKPASAPALIDINSASRAQLKTLPGIGDAEAERIVAGRPYRTKADLVIKQTIPEGVFVSVRDRVIAVQKPGKSNRPTTAESAARPAPRKTATERGASP